MNPGRREAIACAWIDAPPPAGRWGHPDALSLPLSDRGLLLGDGLFETVLVRQGKPQLLDEHLERWRTSAALLGMAPPPAAERVVPLLLEAVERSGIGAAGAEGCGALRLNWSRGASGHARGIELPEAGEAPAAHRFWLQLNACGVDVQPVSTIISRLERRNAASRLSRCKTFAYGAAIQARREARAAGADDALLLSNTGELCCGTTANLLVLRQGRWLTPPLASGCLPGVMRGRGLALSLVQEAELSEAELLDADGALLINSLSCRPIRCCADTDLPLPPEANALWEQLLGNR